jgi:predicted nucleic acid-binding protein
MEVLAGARSDAREADLRRLLLRFHLYRFDAAADFDGAMRIYRRCRQVGVTPRGLIDCMIAAVAWRQQAAILACDVDLDRVARVAGIELDQPNGRRGVSTSAGEPRLPASASPSHKSARVKQPPR